jgi:uncharacterized damage-inducible protein DinB
MSIRRISISVFAVLALGAMSVLAQSQQKKDITMWLQDASSKLVQLAEAMPQEKFSWAPSKDVRTFSEVLMHVASANYFFPSLLGIKSETMIDQEMTKKVTEKAEVISMLKSSFAFLEKAVNETPDADFDKLVKMFGQDASTRSVFLLALTHSHEHLGQSIAYVRSNGVVPPWSKSE